MKTALIATLFALTSLAAVGAHAAEMSAASRQLDFDIRVIKLQAKPQETWLQSRIFDGAVGRASSMKWHSQWFGFGNFIYEEGVELMLQPAVGADGNILTRVQFTSKALVKILNEGEDFWPTTDDAVTVQMANVQPGVPFILAAKGYTVQVTARKP